MDNNIEYKKLIEAALFMSPKALSVSDISGITGIATIGTLESLLNSLVEDYKSEKTSLQILKIDNKYMFGLKEPYATKVNSLASGPDISKGALKILAYVSKNNGVMQSELVKIFGTSTYDYMKELLENEFVKTTRFKRSKKVETTTKFKEYFNV
jgi:segregation and condensation protein B